MIDLAPRVRRIRRDVLHDLRHRRGLVEVQRRQSRAGQRIEQPSDIRRNVLRVLRVAVVHAPGRAWQEVRVVQRHLPRRLQPGRAVDVHRHGHGVRVRLVSGGTQPALHAGDGAVGGLDGVPEGTAAAGERVRAGFAIEIEIFVGRDWGVVLVVVGLQ